MARRRTVNQQATPPTDTADAYTGPPPANADVQAFKINLWNNIRPTNRCGGCHHEGGQSPQFARTDDVNLAYQAALPLVNLTQPDQSTMVQKVGGGHNCWLADPSACASTPAGVDPGVDRCRLRLHHEHQAERPGRSDRRQRQAVPGGPDAPSRTPCIRC